MRVLQLTLAVLVLLSTVRAQDAAAITPVDPQLGRPVDFFIDLYPAFEAKCLACHSRRQPEGALVLERPAAVRQGGDSGPAVVPGDPEQSLLYQLASHALDPVMPPLANTAQAKPLAPLELGLLRQWILEGATVGQPPPSAALNWRPLPAHLQSVQALALDSSARFLAAGRANHVVLFDLTEQREVAQLTDPALLSVQVKGVPLYGPGVAHQDLVHAVEFSPDGHWLASAGYREVKLWERVHESRLAEHDAGRAITALTVSADGVWAATGQADGSVRLWNLSTGQPAATLLGHAGTVHAVAFSPDATAIYSSGADRSLRQWTLADGGLSGQLVTESAATALLVSPDSQQVVAAHPDHVLRVWERGAFAPAESAATSAAQPVREIRLHGQPVTALTWVPQSDEFLTGCRDGNLRLINFADGALVRSFGLGVPVTDVAIATNGERIAACGENGVARIWRRDNGQQLAEIQGDPALASRVLTATDEQTVAKLKRGLRDEDQKAAEKDLQEREQSLQKATMQTEAAVKALADPEQKLTEAEAKALTAAQALAEKPDDEALQKARDAAHKSRDDATAALTKAREAVASAERGVKLSVESLERAKQTLERVRQEHEAATVVAAAADTELQQVHAAAQQPSSARRSLAFAPAGGSLVSGGDFDRLEFWNGTTGASLETLAADAATQFVRCTVNGSLVTVHGSMLIVRDLTPRWKLAGRLGPAVATPLDVTNSPCLDRVLCLAFSPDGKLLATGGGEPSRSGEVLLWELATRQVLREIPDAHSDTVFDLEFSRDGRQLVSGAADKLVKLWDFESGALVRSYEGHTNQVLAVAIKADNATIASGGADNAIKLWNLATGEQRRTVTSFNKQVTALDYIGVSDNLVGCGGDQSVRLLTGSTGNNFRTLNGLTDYVYDAVSSRDQQLIVGAGVAGVIRVWNGQNGNELMKFEPPAAAASIPVTAVE